MTDEREPSSDTFLTYETAGVRYDEVDPFKREAQREAVQTVHNLERFGLKEVPESRGESAYIVDFGEFYLAFTPEGLGTKNLVAQEMRKITGKTYYNAIAQDTLAMMVNDVITVGADPFLVGQHIDAGNSSWFSDEEQRRDFLQAWRRVCNEKALTVWGPGESATLKGIVVDGTVTLSGFCVGMIRPKERIVLGKKLQVGDRILLVASSGIHANYLTVARRIADKLPDGYATLISDGEMYGEALLEPTPIYAPLVRAIFEAGIDIHYMSNITGHGWRKLMRASRELRYIVEKIPEPLPVFKFIQEWGPVEDYEAYSEMNMGAGFAIYVRKDEVEAIKTVAKDTDFEILDAGYLKEGPRQVNILPLGLTYLGETLKVR
jgi:phosphoribosylformylglycinamidine cyclo-ligase